MTTAEWNAIWLSVQVAALSVVISLPIAIAIAWILARKRFVGKAILETVVNLPLVLPPVVTGYLLLVTFGQSGLIGKALNEWLGIRIVFDWKGAALAAAIVSFPLMVRAIKVAFLSVDQNLENAARTLGAKPVDSFCTISLPLAKHGIVAGCLLTFARSLGEFGATIMIAGNIAGETQTIPLYIFEQLQAPGGSEKAYAVIIFSIVISAIALLISEWLDKRGPARQAV